MCILVFGFASVTPYDHAGQESPNIQKATESAIKPYLTIISLTFTQIYFGKAGHSVNPFWTNYTP